ncbi:MAG: hypothetical protein ACRC62_20960 [Microcoleus sp.]
MRITKFTDDEAQKRMVSFENTGEMRYSINGTPIDTGIQYEEHRIWTFEAAHLTRSQRDTIELIARSQNKARRLWNGSQNYAVRLHDWITPYLDVGNVRTRAIATDGAKVGTVTPIGTAGLSYPAQWDVRFLDVPEFSNLRTNSTIYNCQIVLKELGRVLP